MTYATENLYEEIAYVAYHFGWARADILDLEHAERSRYVEQIRRLSASRRSVG